ncbi:MAG: hypothetical protein H3C58_12245 [Fimbriimonadaceae bacterium]|nr:hypothetical protein [Fimbriimonadaceae bacterium]
MKKHYWTGLSLGVTALAVLVAVRNPSDGQDGSGPRLTRAGELARAVEADRLEGDRLYAQGRFEDARKRYENILRAHAAVRDSEALDEIAAVRLRLGYAEAKTIGYEAARETFLETERSYDGLDRSGAAFGGVRDQAAYQAAVCLLADGKREEGIAALSKLFETYPESPLAHAAHRRLVTMDPENREVYDSMLEQASNKRQAAARRSLAMCGPKAIRNLAKSLGASSPSLKDLMEICSTTDDGTTMAGMLRGLASCGLNGEGYLLNRKDFGEMKTPAIQLLDSHYVVVLAVHPREVRVYDPLLDTEATHELPPIDDSEFEANIILVSKTSNAPPSKP